MAEIIRTFDLSTISLPAGTPTITATALADGIAESERSNEIKYSAEYLDYALYGTTSWKINGIKDQYKGMSTVIIPSKINGLPVTTIATNAFAGDTSIRSVRIPPTIQVIKPSAFEGCSKLTDVIFEEDEYYTIYFRNDKNWTDVSCSEERNNGLPYGKEGREMTYEGPDNGYDLYSIRVLKSESSNVLNSIKFNGYNMYGNREYTQEILLEDIDDCVCWHMPDDSVLRYNDYISHALQVNSYAFASTAIKSIAFPAKMGIIYSGLFYDCKSLESVTLPSTLRFIADEAFYGCSALTSITIPDFVTTISTSAFESSGLTSLVIPYTVNLIGNNMCKNCKSLTSVTINGSGKIGDYAFASCGNLQQVIYGPSSNITSIGVQAFYDTKISRVTIPESVIWIGADAFNIAEVFHAVFEHPQGWFYTETGEPSGGTLWNPQTIMEGSEYITSESVALAVALRGELDNVLGDKISWYRILQMPAPTISIADSTMLTITDYSGLAEFFKIYINDEEECRATISASTGELV